MKKVFIIAEAGINHNGKISLAKKLIFISKKAGADAVKFQLFDTDNFINKNHLPKVYKRMKSLEFTINEWKKIISYAKKMKIKIFFSIFDCKSLFLLKKLKINLIKIPSGEITNYELLKKISKTKKEIIISTGMSSETDILKALEILKFNKPSVLHCVSEYPSKLKNNNLNYLKTLSKINSIKEIGFSDHSKSKVLPSVAVTLGATIIEKHITYNVNQKKGDHKMSLNFKDFREMIENIRNTQKALGLNKKIISQKELSLSKIARKGIYLKHNLKKKHKLKNSDFVLLRPINSMNEITNLKYLDGKILNKDLEELTGIKKNDIT
tara:strand:+ start:35 stop:1006 length:972 start_codon:yes stop_codon:yes gene_type:complete